MEFPYWLPRPTLSAEAQDHYLSKVRHSVIMMQGLKITIYYGLVFHDLPTKITACNCGLHLVILLNWACQMPLAGPPPTRAAITPRAIRNWPPSYNRQSG
jgi:hypothetical protein